MSYTAQTPFPFGKYKATPLEELPSTYLVFAIETFKMDEEMYKILKNILFVRLGYAENVYLTMESYNVPRKQEIVDSIMESNKYQV